MAWEIKDKLQYRDAYNRAESSVEAARILLLKAAREVGESGFINGPTSDFRVEIRSLAILVKKTREALWSHKWTYPEFKSGE